ncbi:uncharacterized protein LOC135849818 [Planococcus citri]|uniref:uncharacterized protein LOC135849818 n=1 Tax=Planococcus citri TaxID=170843 RepID=UPI0031F8A085
MWTAEIQDGNITLSSTTTGTSSTSKRPLELSINDTRDVLVNPTVHTSTSQCSGDKRLKTIIPCEQHEQKQHTRTDHHISMKEVIRKWQLDNLAKCVFDNTLNMVLDRLPEEATTVRQETLNMANNYNIEDEAVLMAIEEHGLHQQTQSDDSPLSSSSTEDSSCCSSSADFYQRTNSTTIDAYSHGPDNQEFNFENNFLVTAVSAAIEEKGLTMYI